MNIHPDIYTLCESLQLIIFNYIQDFSEIENWFEIQSSDLHEICQSEVEKWNSEAQVYKDELQAQRDTFLRIGQNQFSLATTNESLYAQSDRSYSKRRGLGKLKLDDSYEYPYSDNSDPIAQLNFINERLNELISIYSGKRPPHIFREIMSHKGTKRHRAYAEMEFLINRAEVLIGLLDRSARSVHLLHNEIDANLSDHISNIENEYNSDYNQLCEEYKDKIWEARKRFETNLITILPLKDLEDVYDIGVSCSVLTSSYKPKTEMIPNFLIGRFEFELSVTKDYEYITDTLALNYQDYIRDGTILILPLLLLTNINHLIFVDNKETNNEVIESFKGYICNYLLSMPAASVNCFFVDGYHSGADFKIYSKLNATDKNIVRNEVATSTQNINQVLDIILKANEEIVQKKLSGYNNLFEFNAASDSIYEKYTLLVIKNFPKGFNDEAFDKLERILIQSEKCGVSVLIDYDDTLFTDEYGDLEKKIQSIKQYMHSYFHIADLMFPEDGSNYTLWLNKTPNNWDDLLESYAQSVLSNNTKSIPLTKLLTDDDNLFSRNSCNNLTIPFGVSGPGKVQSLVFGEGVSHSGILVGTTGSGKSTLLNSIILSAIAHYSPDELQMYLLDFKEGMEFSLYSNNQVPQVKFVSIQSQQELGLSVLGQLIKEISNRSTEFKNAMAKDIETYRNNTGKLMPRILVIIDEFQSLFDISANYKVAEKCADYMKTLIKQGRSYGINVLIATQGIARLHDISLDPGLFAQMTVRIALACDEEDADFMFRINPKITTTFGSAKGTGAYVANDSCSPEKFVTAFMPDNERIQFLKGVKDYYESIGICSNTIVYDGSKSVYFDDLLNHTNDLEGIIGYDEDYKIVIGESMGDVNPVSVEFTPINKNNLLLVVNNQDAARKLFTNYIECLLISKERDSEFKTVSPFIFLCDYRIQTRKAIKEDNLSNLFSSNDDIFYVKNDKGVVEALQTLYSEYQQREEDSDTFNQPLFLVLFGLQNISKIMDTFDGEPIDVDNDDPFAIDMDSNKSKSAGQIFKLLLQKGARRNIFIVAWMDSLQSVSKLEYGDTDYFGNKLLGKMSSDESDKLIDSPLGGALTEEQLAYCNLNSETFKLKIYH